MDEQTFRTGKHPDGSPVTMGGGANGHRRPVGDDQRKMAVDSLILAHQHLAAAFGGGHRIVKAVETLVNDALAEVFGGGDGR